MKCPKCNSMNISEKYRDGLNMNYYHLRGYNRELMIKDPTTGSAKPYIDRSDEHLELLCENCGYGWLEDVKK